MKLPVELEKTRAKHRKCSQKYRPVELKIPPESLLFRWNTSGLDFKRRGCLGDYHSGLWVWKEIMAGGPWSGSERNGMGCRSLPCSCYTLPKAISPTL